MAAIPTCPRCQAPRLAVIYYGADDEVVGGRLECTECGPRFAVDLKPTEADEVRKRMLKKAS